MHVPFRTHGTRSPRADLSCRQARSCLLLLLAVCAGSPVSSAQDAAPAAAGSAAQSNEELQRLLAEERAARIALEKRLAKLELKLTEREDADLEAQLRGLVAPADLVVAPTRTIFPSAANPRIGVFMDSTVGVGNLNNELGDPEGNNFSLRETEVDFSLPISPFAEGVLVVPFEDDGNGDFASSIEEGYAKIGLGGLLDNDWKTVMKLGRFRPQFGRNNQLHLHDWLQVNQPLPVQNLLGPEGIIGNGANFEIPVAHFGETAGEGQTTTLNLAVVNGDILSTSDGDLGALANSEGTSLNSQGPVAVARLSHYVELGTLSDVEVGVSTLQRLDNQAVMTDSGAEINPSYYDADFTWRSRDDETGIGSWLVQTEMMQTNVNYGDSGIGGSSNSQSRDGWWVTVQRQITPSTYIGLLYAESDVLGNNAHDDSISPYVTWYADEFFRVRWQVDRQSQSGSGSDNFSDAYRGLMEVTWNFGAHPPHPYWVNR